MNKVNKSKIEVRRAIWEAYDKKDFYTQEPLEFRNMEVDHIIPKKNSVLLKEFLDFNNKNQVLEDYDLESLYNLIPTSKNINRRKSNYEFSLHTVLLYYELTKQKKNLIEEKILNFKQRFKTDELIFYLKSNLESERDQLNVEEVLDFITDEETYFDEEETVLKKGNQLFLRKYTKRIGIVAKLPTINDVSTHCSIYFRTRNVRDCIIVLDNKTTVGSLFSGLNTSIEYGIRSFIEFEEDRNGYSTAILSLGSNRLRINIEDLNEFCEVVDFYGELYIERIRQIENLLKTRNYPLSSRRNHYKICELSDKEWRKLIAFTFKFDTDSGNSKWHIFDRNRYMIKVFTNKESEKYIRGYHAFFDTEYDMDIVHYSDITGKKRIITWGFPTDYKQKGEECINSRDIWDAEIAYDWFYNELIPEVLGNKKKKKKRSQVELEKLMTRSKAEHIVYFSDLIINHISDLKSLVERLQLHFHSRPNSRYRMHKSNIEDLYKIIKLCANKCGKLNLHYCSSKLGIKVDSKIDFIESLDVLITESEGKTFSGFELDLIFRSLITSMKDNKIELSNDELIKIKEQLRCLMELADCDILLKKYSVNFIE